MDHGMKGTFKRKNCLPQGRQDKTLVCERGIRLVNLPVELEVSQNLGSIFANFVLEKSFTCNISMTNTCKY